MNKKQSRHSAASVSTANPEPFSSWADRGFEGELIPVIPPGVRAKLHGEFCEGDGKTPGSKVLFHRQGEGDPLEPKAVARVYYGHAGWRTEEIHPIKLLLWDQHGLPSNIGLRTARFPCLDVDVKHEDDRALVEAIQKLVRGHVSTWMRYRDNSPSCAIAFRYVGEGFGKGARAFVTPSGHEAKVEFLAAGQQYVVQGMHASGFPLRWRRLGSRKDSLPVANDLPGINGLEGANALLDQVYELVLARGGKPPVKKAASGNCGKATDTTPKWIVQPEQDPFYERLLAEGYVDSAVKMLDGRYKAQMNCPWESEHSERPETGTAYFVGGGFRCSHNACAERRWADVVEFLRELDWSVDAMEVALWNARQRSTDTRALDTINTLRARLAGAK